MRRSRTVGKGARAAWVTRAEASFLARLPVEQIDHRIAGGGLAHRRVGSTVLVDLVGLTEPVRPPVEARSVRGARARSGRALPGSLVVAVVAAAAAIALYVAQLTILREDAPAIRVDAAATPSAPPAVASGAIPVGRDPFASPFSAQGKGDRSGSVLVKPPGVVREGDAVTAAATVVNRDDERWLPPSEVTFVARDANGRVLTRTSSTVSLGPGRAQTVIAPDLNVAPASIAAIEAHIDPAPLRSAGYRAPSVSVSRAAVTNGGKAIEGQLAVARGAEGTAALSCAVFDTLDELAAVSTTGVDLSRSAGGRLRFWLTTQPTTPGPYTVSCSVAR